MLNADQITAKYPHAIVETLRWDATANKQKVTIRTRGVDGEYDGNTREIATSDLFQCFWTEDTKKALDKAKAKAKRAAKREMKAQATATAPAATTEAPAAPVAQAEEALASL
jgi:hypothetical protein